MRLSDAEKADKANQTDLFLLEGENGSKAIMAEDLAKSIFSLIGKDIESGANGLDIYYDFLDSVITVEDRRNTFRGKNLGTEVTEEQWEEIRSGHFKGLFLGDYWVIDGFTWRIADFDYWLGVRVSYADDTITHHLVIFPDELVATSKMNDTTTTSGGYAGSKMHTEVLPSIKTSIIDPAFGETHIFPHPQILTNGIDSNGNANSVVWQTVYISIPEETMVVNARQFSQNRINEANIMTFNSNNIQLALMQHNRKYLSFQNDIGNYWLSDIADSGKFSTVNDRQKGIYCYNANSDIGVRPIFGIK